MDAVEEGVGPSTQDILHVGARSLPFIPFARLIGARVTFDNQNGCLFRQVLVPRHGRIDAPGSEGTGRRPGNRTGHGGARSVGEGAAVLEWERAGEETEMSW